VVKKTILTFLAGIFFCFLLIGQEHIIMGDTNTVEYHPFMPIISLSPLDTSTTYTFSLNGDDVPDIGINVTDFPVPGQHKNDFLMLNDSVEVCRYRDIPFNGPHFAGMVKLFQNEDTLICNDELEWISMLSVPISFTGGGTWAGHIIFQNGYFGIRYFNGTDYQMGWILADNHPNAVTWILKSWGLQLPLGTTSVLRDIAQDNLDAIKIYPNPAHSVLHIETVDRQPVFISMMDLNGSIYREFELKDSNTSLNLSELSQGVYLIRIVQNRSFIVKKLFIY
jgi:hypothetical protein